MTAIAKSRKHRNRDAVPAVQPDHGTPERRQHDELREVATETAGVTAMRVDRNRMIDSYWFTKRPVITHDQHAAGSQFYADWYRGRPQLSVTGAYCTPKVDGYGRSPEGSTAAYLAFKAARDVLGIVHLSAIVSHVVLHNGSVREWASTRPVSRERAMDLFREGLDVLVRHYRRQKGA